MNNLLHADQGSQVRETLISFQLGAFILPRDKKAFTGKHFTEELSVDLPSSIMGTLFNCYSYCLYLVLSDVPYPLMGRTGVVSDEPG